MLFRSGSRNPEMWSEGSDSEVEETTVGEGSYHHASTWTASPGAREGLPVGVPMRGVPEGDDRRYVLPDATVCGEPPSTVTIAELDKLKRDWGIPRGVKMRPLRDGELAARPPAGWASVHESQLRHGMSLPLSSYASYILSVLNLAPGQVSPNA